MSVLQAPDVTKVFQEGRETVAVLHDGDLRFVGSPAQMRRDTGTETLENAFMHLTERVASLPA